MHCAWLTTWPVMVVWADPHRVMCHLLWQHTTQGAVARILLQRLWQP